MIDNLLFSLQQRIRHWAKPATAVLIPGLLVDVIRSRSDHSKGLSWLASSVAQISLLAEVL